jgi:hypothetical protein
VILSIHPVILVDLTTSQPMRAAIFAQLALLVCGGLVFAARMRPAAERTQMNLEGSVRSRGTTAPGTRA